jgi:NADH:ubiquinone oxidoreductase subunit 5 (subunit L)/multisubunit Na+/H+ antiporter MnhA subunit
MILIPLLIFIPILGSLFILPITENSINSKNKIKNIALITSLINLLISIILFCNFDSSTNQIQFVYEFNQLNFCHFNLGVDGLSLFFILLTTILTPVALLSNYKNISNNIKTYFISFLLLETLQICLFTVLDLFLFYIFFESVKCFGSALLCLQLSNSGNTLKLKIPSYIINNISGQNNYLGKVISHKMSGNEMGYRGSKSYLLAIFLVLNIFVCIILSDSFYFNFADESSIFLSAITPTLLPRVFLFISRPPLLLKSKGREE